MIHRLPVTAVRLGRSSYAAGSGVRSVWRRRLSSVAAAAAAAPTGGGGGGAGGSGSAAATAAAAAAANATASTQTDPPPPTTRAASPPPPLSMSRFCKQCGAPMEVKRPAGDSEYRHVCTAAACGFVDYFNPKLVVGCIVEHEGQVLLCRRAIEPCRGRWTTPAGFLELHESAPAGAARETWEEAGARVEIVAPFFHLDVPAIGQAYLLYRARLAPPYTFAASTPESTEVRLVDAASVDHASIAFSSVSVALRAFADDLRAGRHTYHTGTIRRAPGGAPNDPASYALVDHQCFELRPMAPAGAVGGGDGSGDSASGGGGGA